LNDGQSANALTSIRSRLEFDSNVNAESEEDPEKQYSQRIVTEEGMQIDFSDEHLANP
jgi:hypothetical protein